MELSELLFTIKRGEDSKTQFKSTIDSGDMLAAEICAMANTEGGVILVGVNDDGSIRGLSTEEVRNLNQLIANTASQKIDPPVAVTTENHLSEDKIILVIYVPLGKNKFYMANGRDVWVKVGSDKRKAKRSEIQRLLQESGHLYADETTITGTGIHDLDLTLFEAFFQKRTGGTIADFDLPIKSALKNLKLLKDDQSTLAGLLLFGKKPENSSPNLIMKAVSFIGDDPAETYYRDSRDLTGNINRLYHAGMAFLKNNLRMLQKDQNFNSIGILEIPEIALEEALMNAIIHRNYFVMSHIRLFVFDNRVEIISPGTLPNSVTVDSIALGIHIERNPILASLIKDIPEIPYRGIGTGVRRILKSCREAGVSVELVDEKDTGQFKVIFHRQ